MTDRIYRTAAWRKASAACLARDGRWCQIRYPKCKGVATTADHIVDWRDGGDFYGLENLQAACSSCNTAKAQKRRAQLARQARRQNQGLQVW